MSSELRPALVLFVLLSVVTGIVYPLFSRAVGALVFGHAASGSLIVREQRNYGSELIGQSFVDPKHFWGRPSATTPMANNAAASGGSNLGPTNPALIDAVRARITALKAADPGNAAPIPIDLVTASGSGLDPHISPAAAYYQVARVARKRHRPEAQIRNLVTAHIEPRQWGVFGERRVNVLRLNLDLEAMR